MPVHIVQSKHNERLKQLRRALSMPGRDPRGLAGIEGPNLLHEALRAGLLIHCVFAADDARHLLDDFQLPPETEILLMPRTLLASALTTEAPQPIAALLQPPHWDWPLLLDTSRATPTLLVILAGLQDPGNLGTILRSAEAFAAHGVVCLPGTVSPWNPKAVRASAGSLFRLPLLTASADECFLRLRQAGIRVLTTAVHGAQFANLAHLHAPVAIIIGNEGNGVPSEIATLADSAITIPCPGPVESLNASVAASILLYEASCQRKARL